MLRLCFGYEVKKKKKKSGNLSHWSFFQQRKRTFRGPPLPNQKRTDSSHREPTCKTPWSPLWWQGCSRWWGRSRGRSSSPPPCPYRPPPCVQETQASSPSCVSPCRPGESTAGIRSAAVERADRVQAHHLSAVHWTDNSMGSLMVGCGGGGYCLGYRGITCQDASAPTAPFSRQRLHSFATAEK